MNYRGLLMSFFWLILVGEMMGLSCTQRKSKMDHGDMVSILEVNPASLPAGPDHFLKAIFTVWSIGSKPIPLVFNNGQLYDFTVEDEGGRLYWKWSIGKFFTMMIVRRELRKEPWIYRENIPTIDEQGQPLPPGNYILRARLSADRTVENSLSFRIEPAPEEINPEVNPKS